MKRIKLRRFWWGSRGGKNVSESLKKYFKIVQIYFQFIGEILIHKLFNHFLRKVSKNSCPSLDHFSLASPPFPVSFISPLISSFRIFLTHLQCWHHPNNRQKKCSNRNSSNSAFYSLSKPLSAPIVIIEGSNS